MKEPSLSVSLRNAGFRTPLDVLEHLPVRYEDLALTKAHEPKDGERVVCLGHAIPGSFRLTRFLRRCLVSFRFETKGGRTLLVEAWNREYLMRDKTFSTRELLLVLKREERRRSYSFLSAHRPEEGGRLVPVYRLPEGLSQGSFRTQLLRQEEKLRGKVEDIVPEHLRARYRLLRREEALHKAHFPSSYEDAKEALRTLKYEEALLYELRNLLARKRHRGEGHGPRRAVDRERLDSFIASLPYSLLEDQRKALQEILSDMDGKGAMYRLLQGDVGTGKTLVAALSAFANGTRGGQTAIMAPTETLARQHYLTLSRLFAGTSYRVALLTGGTTGEERSSLLQDLEDGDIDLLVGTHALFAKSVDYLNLSLVIIDEQHKFGVAQRTSLLGKGEGADLLLMSATPIPRTLALTLFGDMDVSTLREFPKGRRKVETKWCAPDDPEVLQAVLDTLDEGRECFVVLPHIEGEDTLKSARKAFDSFARLFPGKCVLLHGKMGREEQMESERLFRKKERPILVATSMVEVGIDVPEAGLLVLYEAGSFSLSAAHQLRGRIGRDGRKSLCLLVDERGPRESERIKTLLNTEDGFLIAEKDLALRGPGEVAGTRQSGLPDFRLLNAVDDFRIFECALHDAEALLEDPTRKGERAIALAEEGEEVSRG